MIIKKKIFVFTLLILIFCFFSIQCEFDPSETNNRNNLILNNTDGSIEEKRYSNAKIDDKFVENKVVVVLNKEASLNFKTYKPEDFSEIKCIQVTDSTDLIMEVVKQQLEAEKSGDWTKLKERIDKGLLVDVNNFRRILGLHLPEKNAGYVLEAIKLLEKRQDILYCGPVYYMRSAISLPVPEPVYYDYYQSDAYNNISLPSAWDITTGESNRILVAVADSGIEASHPEFNGLVISGGDFTTGHPWGMTYPYGLEDPNGHGTIVAGIISTLGKKIAGVNIGTRLVSLRVLDSFGDGSFDYLCNAINVAASMRVDIFNASLANRYPIANPVDVEIAIRNFPGLVVAAAGNASENIDTTFDRYPSSYTKYLDNVVAVGAIDNYDNLADFSNYGETSVDLFAPGVQIASVFPMGKCNNGSCDFCKYGGYVFIADGYHTMSGTSQATPVVAGVAALIKSLHLNMTAPELKIALKNSVDVVHPGKCITGGKINASKAVDYIPIVGTLDITFQGTSVYTVQNIPVGDVVVGKMILFNNNRWAIVERGKFTHPIYLYSYADPGYLEIGNPSTVHMAYLLSVGALAMEHIHPSLQIPCSNVMGTNHWRRPYCLNIIGSSATIDYSGERHYPGDSLTNNDMRRLSLEYQYW